MQFSEFKKLGSKTARNIYFKRDQALFKRLEQEKIRQKEVIQNWAWRQDPTTQSPLTCLPRTPSVVLGQMTQQAKKKQSIEMNEKQRKTTWLCLQPRGRVAWASALILGDATTQGWNIMLGEGFDWSVCPLLLFCSRFSWSALRCLGLPNLMVAWCDMWCRSVVSLWWCRAWMVCMELGPLIEHDKGAKTFVWPHAFTRDKILYNYVPYNLFSRHPTHTHTHI